ncbi:Hypothetical protein, putative [Bodo saltans]|uniref:Uncharacterized protein n=1 Tax=Bodo saltans TaxID=75058 RepID=A0A0S4JP48_BODSA|nr:Hypothetical protein, putative [Bodo saltans]|eukprot:CUG91118.1 Hypothetical protein, putative [Bodo saltans]
MFRLFHRGRSSYTVAPASFVRGFANVDSNNRGGAQANRSFLQKISRALSDPAQGVRAAAELYRSEIRPELLAFIEHEDTRPLHEAVFLGGNHHGEECFVLLMKVLCDSNRLEDVRFLFAMALRQFQTPSTELFNVLLIGVTWSDTFTEDEVINVANIMKARNIARDAVTELCFTLAFLRLQRHDMFTVNWGETCRKCRDVINLHLKDTTVHPLPVGFTTKLSQTFATLSRMSANADEVWGEFMAIITPLVLRAIEQVHQERKQNLSSTIALAQNEETLAARVVVTTRILVSALSACLANIAVSSRHILKLFQLLKVQYKLEHMLNADRIASERSADEERDEVFPTQRHVALPSSPSSSSSLGGHVQSQTRASMFDNPCALSEANAARMFARSLRDPNLSLASELLDYTTVQHNVFTSPNSKSLVHVITAQVAAAVSCNPALTDEARMDCLAHMFSALEYAQPEHTTSKYLSGPVTILSRAEDDAGGGNTDAPVKSIVVHASPKPPESYFSKALLAVHGADGLQMVWSYLGERIRTTATTSASIQRVLEAGAERGDLAFCTQVLADLLHVDEWRMVDGTTPYVTSEVYDSIVRCVIKQAERCSGGIDMEEEIGKLTHSMQRVVRTATSTSSEGGGGLTLSQSSLHHLLRYSVESGDTAFGARVVRWYDEYGIPLDRTLAAKLLRNLCHILDRHNVEAVLQSWNKLNGGVHPKVFRMCEMAFKRWGDQVELAGR